jgi:hypothetical protein
MNISPREILLFEINLTVERKAHYQQTIFITFSSITPNPDKVIYVHKTISPFISFLNFHGRQKKNYCFLPLSLDFTSCRLKNCFKCFKEEEEFFPSSINFRVHSFVVFGWTYLACNSLNFTTFSFFFPART